MKQYLKYIFLMVIFAPSMFLKAQISEGGVPPSFQVMNKLRSSQIVPIHTVPVNIDVKRLIWEDSIAERNHSTIRVAEVFPVTLNIDSTGIWTSLSDTQKIWQQTVTASGAEGLIVSYKDFYIPEGGRLFIYNGDKSQVLGAYTHATNKEGGKFATEIIHGDSFTLEYVTSEKSQEKPRIELLDVGYVYDISSLLRSSTDININYGVKSNACIPNINCYPENNKWKDNKRGVVLQLVKKETDRGPAWYACTGSLVNNTKEAGEPYILTAAHCLIGDSPSSMQGSYDASVFYFNYEEPSCSNGVSQPSLSQTMVGSTIKAFIPLKAGSDAALLLLNSRIPDSYQVYFNGWDYRNKVPSDGAVIHHPNRDVKKIAKYEPDGANPAVNIATITVEGVTCASSAHFKVIYNGEGVTQSGSSGAPLFNEDGLIVGTLTAGGSSCDEPKKADYYGRFYMHWDKYQSDESNPPQTRNLKTYLDPDGVSSGYLGGFDPNGTSGNHEIINDQVDFVLFPNPADNEININAKSLIRSIRIFDVAGRLLYSQMNYNASTIAVNVNGWSKGVYNVVVQTSEGKISDKFIKR